MQIIFFPQSFGRLTLNSFLIVQCFGVWWQPAFIGTCGSEAVTQSRVDRGPVLLTITDTLCYGKALKLRRFILCHAFKIRQSLIEQSQWGLLIIENAKVAQQRC